MNHRQKEALVAKLFTPAVPIDRQELFAGRQSEVRKILDAINQDGQHAIIYGERGVGKTSLARLWTCSGKTAFQSPEC